MNVLDMTISRVSRISMALSLMLLASWVWFNFLTQPQAMNLFVTSPSMFQKISLGNLRLPGNDVLQNGFGTAQLPSLSDASEMLQLDSVEVIGRDGLGTSLNNTTSNNTTALNNGTATNFSGAAVQGGPAPLLPSAQRQNIEIADLPFLVNAPPVAELDEGEQIIIAAPSGRLTVNPFAPIYVEEEEPQRRAPVVTAPPANNNQRASQSASQQTKVAAQPVAEPLQPKVAIGVVPTPRPLLPPPSRQSNLPAGLANASLAASPSLLRTPIRSSYYEPSEVPEPVVIEIPAEVVEVAVEPEPVKLDRSRLTGIRLPVNGTAQAGASQAASSQISSRAYGENNTGNASNTGALPSVTQAPANPTLATGLSQRLPQSAGVRAAAGGTPLLQPIGLKQAQLIGRRNVPVVEAPEPVEVVEEVIAAPVLRPVQIALRVPEPVAPVVQAPVIQEPVVEEVVIPEPVVEEAIVETVEAVETGETPVVEEVAIQEPEVVEEVDVVEIPTSQPYIASVSSTLDLAAPVADTTTVQAVAADTTQATTPADVAGASVVAEYVRDNNMSFTGAILGPVSVAIFKSRIGSFHVPIGENIPDTDIRLTNVKRHEVELRQGSESHTIYLDLGQ